MATKLGELKTYYQRKWEDFNPQISEETWNSIAHITGLALPFIGLIYKPAGRALSLTFTSYNLLTTANDVRTAKTWTRVHAWSIVKNGAEFIGTVASLRIGLVIHTVMNLGENFYELREFRTLTWSQTGEKMLPVVTNALYLLTLVSFSNPVSYAIIGTSLLFQAGLSLYKAYSSYNEAQSWKEIKMLDAAAYTAMSLLCLGKGGLAFQQAYTIIKAVPRTFVLMRPASKSDHATSNGGLSQRGKIRAKAKMYDAVRRIAQQHNKQTLMFYISAAAHHEETAKIIASEFGENQASITQRVEFNETKKPAVLRKDLVAGYIPPHIRWKNLPSDEKWVSSPDAQQGIESPAQVHARMDGAIRQVLAEQSEGSSLPVIVTGGTNMKKYLEGEIRKNPQIPAKAAQSIKDGGMRVVTMTPDEMGDLHVTGVLAVEQTA